MRRLGSVVASVALAGSAAAATIAWPQDFAERVAAGRPLVSSVTSASMTSVESGWLAVGYSEGSSLATYSPVFLLFFK